MYDTHWSCNDKVKIWWSNKILELRLKYLWKSLAPFLIKQVEKEAVLHDSKTQQVKFWT